MHLGFLPVFSWLVARHISVLKTIPLSVFKVTFSCNVWGNVPSKLDDFPRCTGSSWEGPAGPKTSLSPASLFSAIKRKPLTICSVTQVRAPTGFALSFLLKSFTRSEEVGMTNLGSPRKACVACLAHRQAPSLWLLRQQAWSFPDPQRKSAPSWGGTGWCRLTCRDTLSLWPLA